MEIKSKRRKIGNSGKRTMAICPMSVKSFNGFGHRMKWHIHNLDSLSNAVLKLVFFSLKVFRVWINPENTAHSAFQYVVTTFFLTAIECNRILLTKFNCLISITTHFDCLSIFVYSFQMEHHQITFISWYVHSQSITNCNDIIMQTTINISTFISLWTSSNYANYFSLYLLIFFRCFSDDNWTKIIITTKRCSRYLCLSFRSNCLSSSMHTFFFLIDTRYLRIIAWLVRMPTHTTNMYVQCVCSRARERERENWSPVRHPISL